MEGRRRRESKRIMMVHDIKSGKYYKNVKKRAEDRKERRNYV